MRKQAAFVVSALLQFFFVLRFALFSSLLLSGCDRLPESFPPPAQRASLEPAAGLSHFIAMNDPAVDANLVSGFREKSEGTWRWAREHPVMRFNLPPLGHARFTMVFVLPDATFPITGPLTLTVSVNGHALAPARFDKAGEHEFQCDVPAEYLKTGVNLVAIEPDKAVAPNPGEKLSFVLIRAGFTE